ncbi:putative oxidoreductase [Paraburkholderia youngii]
MFSELQLSTLTGKIMRYTLFENQKDAVVLVARILLMVLFVMFGWSKLTGFSGTVAYMTSTGAPVPELSAVIAVVMELAVGVALLVGFFTRPLALLLALYTLGTAIIGHHYWNMTGAMQYDNMIHFYKNIGIIGGLLLLCVTGPGKYSFDRR